MSVRVISLQRSGDRRAAITRNLGSGPLSWSFFNAMEDTTAALPYRADLARLHRGQPLTRGEIGLFASHWSLWREHAASEGWMLVLEDDNVPDVGYDYASLLHTMERCGIHYLRLSFTFLQPWRSLGWVSGQHLVRFRSGPYGTGAYLISSTGAATLLRHVKTISRPVDIELDRFWCHGLPPVALFPCLALDTGWGRSILAVARNKGHSLSPADRAARFMYRVSEKARKTAADFALTRFDARVRKALRTSLAHM